MLTICLSFQTIEQVTAVARGETTVGCLRLTDFHLVFTAPPLKDDAPGSDGKERPREIWLAYPLLADCVFRPTPAVSGREPAIRIGGRDFYYITLHFPSNKVAHEAFNFIKTRACRLGSIDKLYAFHYKPNSKERAIRGWDIYDPKAEFRRQGVGEKLPDRGWRISNVNDNYTFASTYPEMLVVPTKITDQTLKYASKFRTRCRVPVLTYLHPVNNCSITRSSQPRVGITGKRNAQDEALVAACFSLVATSESPDMVNLAAQQGGAETKAEQSTRDGASSVDKALSAKKFTYDADGKRALYGSQQHNLIIDARPEINSIAMQVVGKGSEPMEHYKNATKAYLHIQNIHVMRKSLKKVINALKDGDILNTPPDPTLLAKSEWLTHITGILDGSALIASHVAIKSSHVLIHCSDGWDRTSQLSALSQIMLDPYYRTLHGFIVLVEKDWLSFGHMFHQRSGFLNDEKRFEVENDAMAGTRIEPGEGEGAGDAIENAMDTARRFFRQTLSPDKDREDSDPDNLAEAATVEQESAPVIEDQATRPGEISPVFHQFLDAVYQLFRQHPTRFEFNERFLRRLLYHLYSCQYGTFLLNNEQQRKDAKLREKTASVWDHFLARREMFANPQYDPEIDDRVPGKERLILPQIKKVRWWHELFGRTYKEMNGPLDEKEAQEDEKRKREEQAKLTAASPRNRNGTSSPPSNPATPPPGHAQQSGSSSPVFGATVLAGVEVSPQTAATSSGPLSSLSKGLSSLGLGGLGEFGKSLASHAAPAAREQEMGSMGSTTVRGSVAP